MKKLLKIMLVTAGLTTGVIALTYADTVENDSTENTGQYASSSLITTKVKSALLAKKNIDSTKINVQTETAPNNKTIVILTGTQKSQALIDSAVSTTRNVKGVTKVINKLTVSDE